MPAEGPGQAFPKPRRTGVCDLRLVALLLLACTLVGVLIFDIRLLRQQGRPIAHAQPNVAFLRESFVPSAFWGGEWVLVITNYDKDLGWLKDLPLHLPLRLAIFVKQDEKNARTCAMLPQEVSEHVALCREVPNAHGREAHTMSLFFSEYYDRLPRMILFLQVRYCKSASPLHRVPTSNQSRQCIPIHASGPAAFATLPLSVTVVPTGSARPALTAGRL